MTDQAIAHHLQILTSAVLALTQKQGARLTQADLCQRLGVSRSTLGKLRTQRDFPRQDSTGKWLLADVIKWEMERLASQQEKRETRCST